MSDVARAFECCDKIYQPVFADPKRANRQGSSHYSFPPGNEELYADNNFNTTSGGREDKPSLELYSNYVKTSQCFNKSENVSSNVEQARNIHSQNNYRSSDTPSCSYKFPSERKTPEFSQSGSAGYGGSGKKFAFVGGKSQYNRENMFNNNQNTSSSMAGVDSNRKQERRAFTSAYEDNLAKPGLLSYPESFQENPTLALNTGLFRNTQSEMQTKRETRPKYSKHESQKFRKNKNVNKVKSGNKEDSNSKLQQKGNMSGEGQVFPSASSKMPSCLEETNTLVGLAKEDNRIEDKTLVDGCILSIRSNIQVGPLSEPEEPTQNEANKASATAGLRGHESRSSANLSSQSGCSMLGYKDLESMLDVESVDLLRILTERKEEFKIIIQKKREYSWYCLIMRVLSKLCELLKQAIDQSLFIDILMTIKESSFLDQFLFHINKIKAEEILNNKTTCQLCKDFVTFCKACLDTAPQSFCEIVTTPNYFELLIQKMITLLREDEDFQNEICTELHLLQVRLTDANRSQTRGLEEPRTNIGLLKKEMRKPIEKQKYDEPPDDYKTLNIVPTMADINSRRRTFLRPAKVRIPYTDANEYLDIQFRLLREDYFRPFRSGIWRYREIKKERGRCVNRVDALRIYEDVKFVDYDALKGTYIISFSKNRLQRVVWETSKRLMYGSLLCLTKDDFDTGILATVAHRDPKALSERGETYVNMLENSAAIDFINDTFTMAELSLYSEACRNVLRILQQYTEESFPMKEFILGNQKDSCPPDYLRCGDIKAAEVVYDLSSLMHDPNQERHINIADLNEKLTEETTGFDKSQLQALNLALTEKVALIQGPPGTGKTFIGLKIVEVLLKNWRFWQGDFSSRSPILVVCFTNHALDQFLEGILKFTSNVVRIGLVSRTKNLNEYSMYEQRKRHRDMLKTVGSRDYMKKKRTLNDLTLQLVEKNNIVDAVRGKVLLNEMYLLENGVLTQESLWELRTSFKMPAKTIIPTWLGLDNLSTLQSVLHYLESISVSSDLECDQNQLEEEECDPDEIGMQHKICELVTKILVKLPCGLTKQTPVLPKSNNWSSLKYPERWIIYAQWRQEILSKLRSDKAPLERRHKELKDEIEEMEIVRDAYLCKTMDVVAITTTGCAKNDKLVTRLSSKIIVVEEAAEALEVHTLIPMTTDCQHLILIGDHQQLRPSPSVSSLGKYYNLDVSMFERFVHLGMKRVMLSVQHRMRPEVARLIVPAIYPSLENHPSVLMYPNVKGMKHNVFFLTHTAPEKQDSEKSSLINPYEALFALNLARYLLQQGYLPDQITILSSYAAQMDHMKQMRKKYPDHDSRRKVRICAVDSFQGEENDIIILSLVRSNMESRIGFLAIENRVCVALSRAKHGLYIIGNMNSLDSKSTLWKEIHSTLKEHEQIGSELELVCQNHGTPTRITESFNSVIEGGCREKCMGILNCGHVCYRICHIQDRDHQETRCMEECNKYLCSFQHKCKKRCYEVCGSCKVTVEKTLTCGHKALLACSENELKYKCLEMIDKVLPNCQHTANMPCSTNPETYICNNSCKFRLDCGHSCTRKCHKNDDPHHQKYKCHKPCTLKNDACKKDHRCSLKCWETCLKCPEIIDYNLPCGHTVKIDCSRDMNHYKCTFVVEKVTNDCRHAIKCYCHITPTKDMCESSNCSTTLQCGHKCKKSCREICDSEDCIELTKTDIFLACSHKAYYYCNRKRDTPPQEELLALCQEPCSSQLSCGHRCSGNCGECLQGRLHKQCDMKCDRQLVCGHVCQEGCSAQCPPCKDKCLFKCIHSGCMKVCGELCAPCREPCAWKCKHITCDLTCGEPCKREKCNNPCEEILQCGHPCIGLCGEMCPQQCRICDKKELEEFILYGNETEPDSRFIFLPDCNHAIELEGIDYWMTQNKHEVGLRRCPRCNTPITSCTGRFGNIIRQSYREVEAVKALYYSSRDVETHITDLLEKVSLASFRAYNSDILTEAVQGLRERVQHFRSTAARRKRFPFGGGVNKDDLELAKIQVKIIGQLVRIANDLSATSVAVTGSSKPRFRKIFLFARLDFLSRNCMRRRKFSQEELDDFLCEIERLDLQKCLWFVQSAPMYKRLYEEESSSSWLRELVKISENLSLLPLRKYATLNNDFAFSVDSVELLLNGVNKLSLDELTATKSKIEGLLKLTASNVGLGISDRERKMIVTAMGMKQGHWFKCPNGHIYCITECGGAMQESFCNECGAPIGGRNHFIRDDNDFASEMDGATSSAWPYSRFQRR
ncbi:hypothetical protein QYM36_015764 [Artemia franciscana]|uniref:RZ-type domain-containing protein n=1 Tax=Artemia franciscana TaxID=6661 RepID=A0AA88HHK4_ARTSF|nr:hypothetical protein QYM36_015764 [Artemia franciscana]